MTPIFLSAFWSLFVCNIYFCIWKLSKFFFMESPRWAILVCEIPGSWRRTLWDQKFVPFDSWNIRIEESNKPDFTFSIKLRINSKVFRVISSSFASTLRERNSSCLNVDTTPYQVNSWSNFLMTQYGIWCNI